MQLWQYKTLRQPLSVTVRQMRSGEYTIILRTSKGDDPDTITETAMKTQRGQTRFFKRLETVMNAVKENETVTNFEIEIYRG